MKYSIVRCGLLLLLLISARGVYAAKPDEAVNNKSSIWKTELSLGLISTAGNTETTNTNASIDVENDRVDWRHFFSIQALYSKEDSARTGQKLSFSEKTDYKLVDDSFLYGAFLYEDDRFNGYDYQTSFSVGYGRRVINQETLIVDVEIGPGFRYSKYEEPENDNEDEEEPILRLGGKAVWTISATTSLKEGVSIEIGSESTISKSLTSFVTQIAGSISMKTSFDIKHSSNVPDDKKKLDTKTSISLVYSF